MINTVEVFGNYSGNFSRRYSNIVRGIKLRIKSTVSSLQNIDLSQNPDIDQVKYVLLNMLNWSDSRILGKRNEIYRLLSLIDQSLPYISNMDLTNRALSSSRSAARSATTVSGNVLKPLRAGKAEINKKDPKAKYSKKLIPPKTSGITDYMPWVIVGGIALVVILGGKKLTKR